MEQVKGGKTYEGIFSAIEVEAEGGLSLVLKMATTKLQDDGKALDMKELVEKPVKSMIITGKDLVQLVAKDVKMNAVDVGPEAEDMGFGTDAAISKERGGAG